MVKLKRRKGSSNDSKLVKSGIKKKSREKRKVNVEFFTTGCTMMNLAISGHRKRGIPRCRVTNIVGDGSAGKTLLALECAFYFLKLIGSIISNIFGNNKKGIVVYNNGEGVMDFPLDKMYGENFKKQVKWRRSKTIEAAGRDYLETAKNLKKDEALLYIIDSWDSFKSIHDKKILNEKDEDIIQGYNLKKQQFAWSFFAQACELLEDNNCDATLIVISQTKQKIGVTFGKKKYRTGGDALNFYTHLIPWLRTVKELKKTKNGDSLTYGIESEFKIERSKVGYCFRQAPFMHLYDYGIDDIGSMALYLRNKKITKFKGIKISMGNLHNFSKRIEQRKLREKLSKYVEMLWNRTEEQFQKEISERERKVL